MKKLLPLIPALLLASSGMAQQDMIAPISDTQKEEFIEMLKALQNQNMSRKMQLIRAGIAALTPAVANESEAMSLFEKCYKKIQYDDVDSRENKDWRKWRTDNKDKFTNAANKRALKYQMKWALITLQAAMEPEDTFDASKYAPQALSLLGEIMRDDKWVLLASDGTFNRSILTNEIGQVYELNSCRPKGQWPDSIMDYRRVIDMIIIQPARVKKDIDGIRKGWNQKISLQKLRDELDSKAPPSLVNNARENRQRNDRRFRRFDPSSIEDMEWEREVDCFRNGDEIRASSNMLSLIRRLTDPRKQEMRINQMLVILQGEDEQERGNPFTRNRMVGGARPNTIPAPVPDMSVPAPAPVVNTPPPAPARPAPAPAKPPTPSRPIVEEITS